MIFKVLFDFIRKKRLAPTSGNNFKVFIIFIGLVWYSSSGFLFFEIEQKPDLGWSDALWWTIVTMSTVGYGDLFPVTSGGRFLIGVPTMIFGIGFLGFIISATATRLIEARSKKLQGLAEVSMKNHVLIINYTSDEEIINLINQLRADSKTRNQQICLVDEKLAEIPMNLRDAGVAFIKGNPSDESILERACLSKASYAIILSSDRNNPHSDDQNLATTLILEKMNPDIFSIVEVLDPRSIRQMELAGADCALCLSDFRSNLIIQELEDPGLKNILMELTSNEHGDQFYLVTIESMQQWTYRELVLWGLEKNYSVTGILRGGKTSLDCTPDFQIEKGDRAVLIGRQRINTIAI
jgi:voltage-gated potassium channel